MQITVNPSFFLLWSFTVSFVWFFSSFILCFSYKQEVKIFSLLWTFILFPNLSVSRNREKFVSLYTHLGRVNLPAKTLWNCTHISTRFTFIIGSDSSGSCKKEKFLVIFPDVMFSWQSAESRSQHSMYHIPQEGPHTGGFACGSPDEPVS